MLIVHTADNHLDAPLSSLPPEISEKRKVQRRLSFSKIIDYTINNQADCLLISGDLFDSPTPSKALLSFCALEFKRLGSIPVFIALGNHDYALTNEHFPGNVHIFTDDFEQFKLKDATLTGVSFSKSFADFSDKIPSPSSGLNILCIHGDIFTKSEYNPLNKEKLLSSGYDYIALGHIHYHYQEANLVYPGCHDATGFDESGEKGFICAKIDSLTSTVSFIPSSSAIYNVFDFDVSKFSSSYEIADSLTERCKGSICKINLVGSLSENAILDIPYITSFLSQYAIFVKIYDKTQSDNLSQSRMIQEFSHILTSDFPEDIAALALKYGIDAMKGVDFNL